MRENRLRTVLATIAVFTVTAAITCFVMFNPAEKTKKDPDLPLPAKTELSTQVSTFLKEEILMWHREAPPPESASEPENTEEPTKQPPTEETQSPTEALTAEALALKVLVSLASDPLPEPMTEPPPPETEAPTEAPPQPGTEPPDATRPPEAPPPQQQDKPGTEVPFCDVIPEPYGYFGDIIMLGDSMTTGFDMYRGIIKYEGKDVLRDVTVIAVVSYGINNALREISDKTIHPLYMGKQTRPEDIIAQKEAKYVFICLGLNDIIWQATENFIKSYAILIGRIKEKSPEKTIVIMSLTPVVAGTHKSGLNNAKIMEANAALAKFAAENGIPFVDYAAAIRDSQNNLPGELSSDNYCHFTIPAYNKLVEYMLHHPVGR